MMYDDRPLYTRRTPPPLIISPRANGGSALEVPSVNQSNKQSTNTPTDGDQQSSDHSNKVRKNSSRKHSKTNLSVQQLVNQSNKQSDDQSSDSSISSTPVSEIELDLDLINDSDDDSPTIDVLSFEDQTINQSINQHYEQSDSDHNMQSNHSNPSFDQPTKPSINQALFAWLALAAACLSLAAVGPTFLYLSKFRSNTQTIDQTIDQSINPPSNLSPILIAFNRNLVILVFLIGPAFYEWFSIDKSKRALSQLYVPPSPRVQSINQSVNQGGVTEEMELSDLEKIDNFLDDQSNMQMVKDMEDEFAEDDESINRSNNQSINQTIKRVKTIIPEPPVKTTHVLFYVLLASISWGGSLSLWVTALCYTTTARASMFSSVYPIFLLAYFRIFRKVQISAKEIIGVAICVAGIVLSETLNLVKVAQSTHTIEQSIDQTINQSINQSNGCPVSLIPHVEFFGDFLCICASLLIAIQITTANKSRQVLPLFSFTFLSTVFVTFFLGISTVIFESTTLDFVNSPKSMFGFLFDWDLFLFMVLFGFVVGMIGLLCFNYAIAYVHPLVFASAQLVDPGLTALMSYFAGLEPWPPLATFLGVAIISLGIGCVVVGEHHRKQSNDQSVNHVYEPLKQADTS